MKITRPCRSHEEATIGSMKNAPPFAAEYRFGQKTSSVKVDWMVNNLLALYI